MKEREREKFEGERDKMSNFLSNPMVNIWLGEKKRLVDVNDFGKKLEFFKDIHAECIDNKNLRRVF